MADFLAWLALGACAGFWLGRRSFNRRFAAATSDPENIKAFRRGGATLVRWMRGHRLGTSIAGAILGTLAGALIWAAGWGLVRLFGG